MGVGTVHPGIESSVPWSHCAAVHTQVTVAGGGLAAL